MKTEELGPKEIDPKICAIAKRLEEMIPLFAAYEPKGWIDFRDKELSKSWRGGTFLKSEAADGWLIMKGIFGSRALANLAASQLTTATGIRANPETLGGGERSTLWQVLIEVSLDEVNW